MEKDFIIKKAEHIYNEFKDFSDGLRMLILLERKKDGGHNKEEKRSLCTRFTFSPEGYKTAITELLMLKRLYPEARLYASVNPRNIKKVIKTMETELLECHYSNDEEKNLNTHKKLIKSTRHFVMQQSNRIGSLFILDIDELDTTKHDIQLEKLCIEVVKRYRTKNGWHIVTKPFNPALYTLAEIKKDGLILLDY